MMSVQTPMFPVIPAETASAVAAMFGKGNSYVVIGDRLDSLFAKLDLTRLDHGAKPAYTLLIYALVTVFQFNERLPDRRATEALRSRLDWKYALHLPLAHPGIVPLALCEFRRQLRHNPLGLQTFQGILESVAACGLSPINGETPPEASGVLASICNLSRLEQITDALCVALETLAATRPDWLLKTARPYWYDRYTTRQSLRDLSSAMPDQLALAQAIGSDAAHLLDAVNHEASLVQLPEIQFLQRVYTGQFDLIENEVSWRLPQCVSCSLAD
jgi:transposase